MDVNWSPDSTQAYAFWTREFDKLLARCFSKRTVKMNKAQHHPDNANKSIREILARLAKKGRIQRQIAKKYLERVVELETRQEAVYKTSRLKETMAKLSYEDKFSPNGYWKLKKAADKNLSTDMVYTIMKEDGVEVSGESLIKEAYKEEFRYRLRTREPYDGWCEYVEELNSTIRNWLNTKSASSPPFTAEELDKVISKLKKGKVKLS